jgi:biotin carboxylase
MSDLPRLGIFQNESTVSIFDLVAAASGLCRIVWIVGWALDAPPARTLSRFGDVADVSGMATDEIIAHLAKFELSGVAVFNDPPLVVAAAVAEKLHLRFHSPTTASVLSDKLLQRQVLRDSSVPVPSFAAVSRAHPDSDVPFPAVLKPRAGAGARDTFLVRGPQEVADALNKCDPQEDFILEEWLPDRTKVQTLSADVVSVESITRDGDVKHLVVTGRFPYAPPFRDTGGFLPSDLNEDDWKEVCELAGTAVRAAGIRDGIIHTEIKMTPAGPRVVEINGRLGGGVSNLVERIGGPSLNTWVMKLALGQDVGSLPTFDASTVGFFYFLVAPQNATTFEGLAGLDELNVLKSQLNIDEIHVNVQPGEAVSTQKTSFTAYVLRIDGVALSHRELTKTLAVIDKTLTATWGYS